MSNKSNDSGLEGCVFGIVVAVFIIIVSIVAIIEKIINNIRNHPVVSFFIVLSIIGCVVLLIIEAKKDEDLKKKLNEEKKKHQREKLLKVEKIREENAKRDQIEEFNKANIYINEFINNFSKYLAPCFVIDSNIWMNENYNSFFEALNKILLRKKFRIALYGPQFDEISNIKKNTEYGEQRNKRARLAIARIEDFQKKDLLRIKPITIEAERRAYADPMIVKLITSRAQEGVRCTFISDDVELRVRVREHLNDYSKVQWHIIEMYQLLPSCKKFVDSLKVSVK